MIKFDNPVSARTAFNAAIIDYYDSTFVDHDYTSQGNRWFLENLGGVDNITHIQRELGQIDGLFTGVDQAWDDGDIDGLFGIVLHSCDGRRLEIWGPSWPINEGLQTISWA